MAGATRLRIRDANEAATDSSATLQLEVTNVISSDIDGRAHKRRRVGPRREKYVARACDECQQRKVKCSGEDRCYHCRARNSICVYSAPLANSNSISPAELKRKKRIKDIELPPTVEVNNRTSEPASIAQLELSLQQRVQTLEEELKAFREYRLFSQTDVNFHDHVNTVPQHGGNDANVSPGELPSNDDQFFNLPHSELGSEDRLFDSAGASKVANPYEAETDTFEHANLQSHSLSLSSQLTGLRSILGLGSMSVETSKKSPGSRYGFSLDMPDPLRLRHLLAVYFRDFDCFLPYLDQSDTERRIFETLETLGYSDNHQKVYFEHQCCSILALLCNMLAMAECLDPEENNGEDEDARPGWGNYIQGMKLIQHCSSPELIDLDVVRYYAVGSGYFMHSECLQAATHAISMAIQLATKVRLNNQTAWTDCSSIEILCQKKLWWTIYFMDRRIGQKNGAPYLIRDSEVGVDDFTGSTPSRTLPLLQRQESGSNRHISPRGSDSENYLQVLIDLGRLWGQVWDSFFAVNATKLGDLQEIEIMDTRILFLQRHLPQHLTWDQEMASLYVSGGETEPQVRRRLATFARINTMRLVIRQNPLIKTHDDLEPKRFCAELARQTIEAIAIFNRSFSHTRPSGYFVTTSLVECICHLVPLLQAKCLLNEKAAAVDAFRTAYQILVDLARTMNGATRAVKALRNVFSVDESVSFFRSLVSETGQIISGNGDDALQHGSQGHAETTISLPEALKWPADLNHFMIPKSSKSIAKPYEQGVLQSSSQHPDALSAQKPSPGLFRSPIDLEGFSMSINDHSADGQMREIDFGSQDFMYGDIMAEMFS